MTTALATTTGAGATSVHHKRKVPRNKSGLSYREWLNNAGVSSSQKHFAMWREDKDIGAASAADNPGGGMSTGTKVGLAVGGTVIGLAVITAGLWYFKKRAAAASPYACKAGNRYQFIVTAPAGNNSLLSTVAQPLILLAANFKNVTVPVLTPVASNPGAVFMADCVLSVDTKTAFAGMIAAGFAVSVSLMGVTPAGA